ncbi:hypothetical protein BX666DRAFT_1499439 [Dichotomocladium elegans]|nr:hypothetical protein BX666DRAFT_1499439 [Dichotomocladium elegans]
MFGFLLPAAADYVIAILTSREALKSLRASERIIISSEGSVSFCINGLLRALLIGTLSATMFSPHKQRLSSIDNDRQEFQRRRSSLYDPSHMLLNLLLDEGRDYW